jgi:hypothetical protein
VRQRRLGDRRVHLHAEKPTSRCAALHGTQRGDDAGGVASRDPGPTSRSSADGRDQVARVTT